MATEPVAIPSPDAGGPRLEVSAGRRLWRALRLRCPRCGGGGVARSWFSLHEACAVCGLRFERDEQDDYWLGAFTLNFITTEVVFAAWLTLVLVATWPAPPWTAITWIGVIQMCVTPILFYPFSKAVWLAVDLLVRPARSEDFG